MSVRAVGRPFAAWPVPLPDRRGVRDYLAIMDLFSATLLTDLSAAEVAAQLAERGLSLTATPCEARCRQLVGWGNLVPSIRDARVATVAEYIRSRSRYQVSKLGGRLHRRGRRDPARQRRRS